MIDRPKVPIHHEFKKSYKVALRDAFFIWNEPKLNKMKETMKKDGYTNLEIEHELYFNVKMFTGCIERNIPSPKILYWRV